MAEEHVIGKRMNIKVGDTITLKDGTFAEQDGWEWVVDSVDGDCLSITERSVGDIDANITTNYVSAVVAVKKPQAKEQR